MLGLPLLLPLLLPLPLLLLLLLLPLLLLIRLVWLIWLVWLVRRATVRRLVRQRWPPLLGAGLRPLACLLPRGACCHRLGIAAAST